MVKLVLTMLAFFIGSVGGGLIAYIGFAPIYLIYAAINPLDPSSECARGNALAYLSILIGTLVGGILVPIKVWRQHD